MKRIYLIVSVLGFVLPNILVAIESIENLNILLYTDIMSTIDGMFANRISSIFVIDLLWAVAVFFIWSRVEAKQLGIMNKMWWVWLSTMLLGLAGAFPLFFVL